MEDKLNINMLMSSQCPLEEHNFYGDSENTLDTANKTKRHKRCVVKPDDMMKSTKSADRRGNG